jgi:hypothetical protein
MRNPDGPAFSVRNLQPVIGAWPVRRCARLQPHAGVRCGAHQRKQLERLCRYITRSAVANERLERDGKGRVVLQLRSPSRDGTTHIKMSAQAFKQRLAALVARLRVHLIRFHGVLAPNAGRRAAIVPDARQNTCMPAHGAQVGRAPAQARVRSRPRALPAVRRSTI